MAAGSDEVSEPPPAPAERVVAMEERDWLPRHVRGDTAAFPALLSAYRRPVYGYLVRAGVGAGERDNLFQAIFLRVHRAARDYLATRPLAPWLFTIAAHVVRNHFRDSSVPGVVVALDDGTDVAADPAPGPERAAAARITVDWLEGALAALPETPRQVLLLIGVVGLGQGEVAAALDLPLGTVKTHLRRARLRLAAELAHRDDAPLPKGEGDDHL